MAASLANGGLCPLSGDQVLSPVATKSMLSMMQVAGMKDYSATFQYKVQIKKPKQHFKCIYICFCYNDIINIWTPVYFEVFVKLAMIADIRPCCGEP